jgi:hypothetical protein
MAGSLELGSQGVAEAGAAVASASVATMPVAMRWVVDMSTCLLWLVDRGVRSVAARTVHPAGSSAVEAGRETVDAGVETRSIPATVLVVASSAGGTSVIEFRVLGSFEVVDADGPLALGGPKQRALLAVLLLHRGEVVSTDRLIDQLWGEQPPASANKIVQGYVSNLRKALGDGVLVTRGGGYVLETGPGQVDADRFDALAADGRRALESGDGRGAGVLLSEALALWRGPPLVEFAYQEFAQPQISGSRADRNVKS